MSICNPKPKIQNLKSLLVAGALILLWASPALAQGWWNPAWKARRTLKAEIPAGVEGDEPTATATFMTHGWMKEDATDLRIIAKGREVPYRVLRVGPGDQVSVAFQLVVGVDSYQAYYGNPKAPAPKYDWEIRAGVLLEVKRFTGGQVGNVAAARAFWNRTTAEWGAEFIPNIFLGINPFGPSDAFMSHYTAWLRVDKPGVYEFFKNASNASHLLLDGDDLGGGGRWKPKVNRRPQYVGEADLKPGRYKLELYHFHLFGDMPVATVAWQPPGADRPEVIPPGQFLPVARASVLGEQVDGQSTTPDFEVVRHVDASLDPSRDAWVHRYEFRDVTPGLDRKAWRAHWDFGDGVTSTMWTPTHVYLADGAYTVTWQLKGAAGTVTTKQRIVVSRNWAEQASAGSIVELEDCYPVVKGYDFAAMPGDSLAAAAEMFQRLKRDDEFVRVERELLFGDKALSDASLQAETERLAAEYLNRLRDPKSAADAYLNAEKRAGSNDAKARYATKAAWVLVEELNDADKAREAARRALDDKPAKAEVRRRAILGLAECAIFKGDAKEAEQRLREAVAIPVPHPEHGGEAVRVGSLSRAVEDYIRRNEFATAKDLLDTWEWEYPLDRLVGYSTVLRARLAFNRGEFPRAVSLLTSLVAVNPRSNYAAEALMNAALSWEKLGDKAKARDTYRRVPAEYPESPYVKDAIKQSEGLK